MRACRARSPQPADPRNTGAVTETWKARRTPLLTVTNFSDTAERIDIWATRDAGSKILKTLELPAKASVHLDMRQEFTQRGAEFVLQSR